MIDELKKPTEIPAIPEYMKLTDRQVQEMLMVNFIRVKDEVNQLIKEELTLLRKDAVKKKTVSIGSLYGR